MKAALFGNPQSGRTVLFKYLGEIPVNSDRLPKQISLKVNDPRVDRLTAEYNSAKVVRSEFVLHDTTGDIETDGRSLELIRPAEVLLWQLRGYDGGFGTPTPAEDFQILKELSIEMDLKTLKKRHETIQTRLKRGAQADDKKNLLREAADIEKMINHLESGKTLRSCEMNENTEVLARNFGLISAKPALIHVACDEDHFAKKEEILDTLRKANGDETQGIDFRASMPLYELELQELGEEDAAIFREEAGITHSAREEIVDGLFAASDREVFLTAGPTETHSWLLKKGANAVEAAGTIHSDFAKGFIRAEVLSYADYEEFGTYKDAKNNNKVRLEGKDYIVKDGDIILFRFNV